MVVTSQFRKIDSIRNLKKGKGLNLHIEYANEGGRMGLFTSYGGVFFMSWSSNSKDKTGVNILHCLSLA